MKKLILGVLLLAPALSFASSYEEQHLAQCGNLTLIQVKIGSQLPDGTVSSSISYQVDENKNRVDVGVDEMIDLTVYKFVLSDKVAQSITKSFEITETGGAVLYRYNNQVCKSL